MKTDINFDFSDDQEQLRDAVRRWVDWGYAFKRRRAIAAAGGFDRSAYRELAELGLAGLYVSEAHGGLGMGPVEGMVVMEELGRGLVLEPMAQTLIASGVIGAYATQALQTEWLPRIVGGDAIVVLANYEHKARWRLEVCETRATLRGSHWTIDGAKSLVPIGDQADALIVPANVDGKVALFLVERHANGVSGTVYGTQDGARSAEIKLHSAPATLLTQDGMTALEHAVDIGIAATCAEAVGVLDKTMAITVDYVNTRKQFGVSISTFQALRHRVADMKMQLELARSMSYYATLKVKAPTRERRQAMARAKYQMGVAMRFIGQNAVQLHGGIGVTDEYIGSHCFKKLTQLEQSFGDTFFHLGKVSEGMTEQAAVFASDDVRH